MREDCRTVDDYIDSTGPTNLADLYPGQVITGIVAAELNFAIADIEALELHSVEVDEWRDDWANRLRLLATEGRMTPELSRAGEPHGDIEDRCADVPPPPVATYPEVDELEIYRCPNGEPPAIYEIQPGDSPGSVAERLGVTVQALGEANNNNPGYQSFIVGVSILVPCPDGPSVGPASVLVGLSELEGVAAAST